MADISDMKKPACWPSLYMPVLSPRYLPRKAPPMPSRVVMMKPEMLLPGTRALANSPTKKPITIVAIILMGSSYTFRALCTWNVDI